MKTTAIIVAAGSGRRMGAGFNKVYMPLYKKTVLYYTLKAFSDSRGIDEIVLVTGKEDFEKAEEIGLELGIDLILTEGGSERQHSVINGIERASGDIVLIHDGARALITKELIQNVLNDAKEFGAAALGVTPKDTIKVSLDGFIESTLERERAYLIQTPQVFLKEEILNAHKRALEDGFLGTDDCSLMERLGKKIKITLGSYENMKITTPEDIYGAEKILKSWEDI